MENPRPAPRPPSVRETYSIIGIPYENMDQGAGVTVVERLPSNNPEPKSARMHSMKKSFRLGSAGDQAAGGSIIERRALKRERERERGPKKAGHGHSMSMSEAASRRTQLYSNFGGAWDGTMGNMTTIISGGLPTVDEKRRTSSRQKGMFRRSSLSPNAVPSTLEAKRNSRTKSTYARHGHSLSHSGFDTSFDPTMLRKNRHRPKLVGMSNQDHLYQEYDDLFDDPAEDGEQTPAAAKKDTGTLTASPFSRSKKEKRLTAELKSPVKPSGNIVNVVDSDTDDDFFLLHFSEISTALAARDGLDPPSPPGLSDGGSSIEDSHSGEASDHDCSVAVAESSCDEQPLPPSPLPLVTPLKFSFKSNMGQGRRQSTASSVYSSYTMYTTCTVTMEDRHVRHDFAAEDAERASEQYVPSPLSSARSSMMSLVSGLTGSVSSNGASGGGGAGDDGDDFGGASTSRLGASSQWGASLGRTPGASAGRVPHDPKIGSNIQCLAYSTVDFGYAEPAALRRSLGSIGTQRATAGCQCATPRDVPHDKCTTSTTTAQQPQREDNNPTAPPLGLPALPAGDPDQLHRHSVARKSKRLEQLQLQRPASPSSIYSDDSAVFDRSALGLHQRPISSQSIFAGDSCSDLGLNISHLPTRELGQEQHLQDLDDFDSDVDDEIARLDPSCRPLSPLADSPGKLYRHFGIPTDVSSPKTASTSDAAITAPTPDPATMRTERKSCLFDEVDSGTVAPLFYSINSKKAFNQLQLDTPRASMRQSMITITSPLSPLHTTTNISPQRRQTRKPIPEMDCIRDSMISAVYTLQDSDLQLIEGSELWTPESLPKRKPSSNAGVSPSGTVASMVASAFDEPALSDGESCASEVIGDQDSMKEVVMRPKTQFFNPSAWQYYDNNYQIESKVKPEVETSVKPSGDAAPQDPTTDTTYLRAFRTFIKRSGPHDAFIQRHDRLEAANAERIFRDVKQIETKPMCKKHKVVAPVLSKASRQRAAQDDILANVWSLMAERWLCFGKVVCSPAHDVLLAASAKKLNRRIKERNDRRASEMLGRGVRVELDDGSERRRVLNLGGEAFAGWGWHCAYDYPKAKVYTVTQDSTAAEGEKLKSTAPKGPKNHRHVVVPKMWELPFPENHFDLVSARDLFAHVTSAQHTSFSSGKLLEEMDLVIEECNRVLKPGGYLEYMVLDAEMLNPGEAGQAFNATIASHLESKNIDPAPSKRFIKRLNRNGFKKVQRAWIFQPLAPTFMQTRAPPKEAYERTPLPNLPGSPKVDVERIIAERREESLRKVENWDELGQIKGDAQNVAAISGLLAGRMVEKWGIETGMEGKPLAALLAEVIKEEREGKNMGGFRTLQGWARKTPKVHSV